MKRLIGITVLLACLAVPAFAAGHGASPHPSHKTGPVTSGLNLGTTVSDAEAINYAKGATMQSSHGCGVWAPYPCAKVWRRAIVFKRVNPGAVYIVTESLFWYSLWHQYLLDVDGSTLKVTHWDLNCGPPTRCDWQD